MAVPKRKTPRQKTRQRRASAWTLKAENLSTCAQCNSPKLGHIICDTCGFYKGRQVIDPAN
jgi:large subunit ribosomal protein L32